MIARTSSFLSEQSEKSDGANKSLGHGSFMFTRAGGDQSRIATGPHLNMARVYALIGGDGVNGLQAIL